MARLSQFAKMRRKLKFKIRQRNRCRICFRGFALKGEIPGVVKASW